MALFSKPLFTTLFLSSLSTTFQDISVFSDLLRIGLRYMWWGDTTQHSFWMRRRETFLRATFLKKTSVFARTLSMMTSESWLRTISSIRQILIVKAATFFVVFYATVFFFYRYDGKKSFAVGQLYMRAVFYFERDCLTRKMLYYLDSMHRLFFQANPLYKYRSKKLWPEP